jgi:hypothetical protein
MSINDRAYFRESVRKIRGECWGFICVGMTKMSSVRWMLIIVLSSLNWIGAELALTVSAAVRVIFDMMSAVWLA